MSLQTCVKQYMIIIFDERNHRLWLLWRALDVQDGLIAWLAPLAGPKIYQSLGYGWGNGLFAILLTVFMFLTLLVLLLRRTRKL
jgi:hypothetical protein